MSNGPGYPFESVIVSIPEQGLKTNLDSELVVFSRGVDISPLAIYDTNKKIKMETLKKIDTGSNCNKRKNR